MKIYIASSWKNKHAVEMLTGLLRGGGHEVLSFVEADGQYTGAESFEEWLQSESADRVFSFDTNSAMFSDLVIYLGPSGTDAWAEVGAAYASGVPVLGLWAKGEPAGLMRKMVVWYEDYSALLSAVAKLHSNSD